jgi:hypothetical protein
MIISKALYCLKKMCIIQNIYVIKAANLLVIVLNEINIKSMYTFDFTSLILPISQ